jgi:hypothetical protein
MFSVNSELKKSEEERQRRTNRTETERVEKSATV